MNRRIISLILVLLWATAAGAQDRLAVRVAAETTVETDIVRLGLIARIDGPATAVERLKSISLGYAPNVGTVRELARPQLVLALNAAGFSESEVGLETPPKIVLRRAGQSVSTEQIRAAVEKYLADRFAGDRLKAVVKRLDAPGGFQIPTGELAIVPNFSSVLNYFQPFSLPVEVRVDGRVVRRIAVNVEIEAEAEVLVAARELTVGQKLGAADVKIETRRLIKPLANYLRDPERLRGLTLVKPLAAGAELTLDTVVSGVVVRSGDPVRVEARSGRLTIMISGEARASGRIGDRVAVKNLQSGAILQAVVVDEGLVRVLF
ncbi:MAG: flagellar basal body P-ring formation protein FlgA [Acidobacteria bacterium]|nr:flagellar basal body P-ring formation protein FlgA [Acidobacteriota bacterium]